MAHRIPKGGGGINSPLFTHLNYDVRCVIYSYLTPILTSPDSWLGFIRCCRQAHYELTAVALINIKGFINLCLSNVRRQTGAHLVLEKAIRIDTKLSELRYLTVQAPVWIIYNKTQEGFYNRETLLRPGENRIDDPKFIEDKALVALHPLFSSFFHKITISLHERDMQGEEVSFRGEDGLQERAEKLRWRIYHALDTLSMLITVPLSRAQTYGEGTPGHRLSQQHLSPIATKCIAIAWNVKPTGYPGPKLSYERPWTGYARYLNSDIDAVSTRIDWSHIYTIPHSYWVKDEPGLAGEYGLDSGLDRRHGWKLPCSGRIRDMYLALDSKPAAVSCDEVGQPMWVRRMDTPDWVTTDDTEEDEGYLDME